MLQWRVCCLVSVFSLFSFPFPIFTHTLLFLSLAHSQSLYRSNPPYSYISTRSVTYPGPLNTSLSIYISRSNSTYSYRSTRSVPYPGPLNMSLSLSLSFYRSNPPYSYRFTRSMTCPGPLNTSAYCTVKERRLTGRMCI